MVQKDLLRKELRRRLQSFFEFGKESEKESAKESQYLRAQLLKALEQIAPDVLLAFVPKPRELQIWPLLQKFRKELAFAKVHGSKLQFISYPEAARPLPDWEDVRAVEHQAKDLDFWHYNQRFHIIEPRFGEPCLGEPGLGTGDLLQKLSLSPLLSPPLKIVMLCPGLGFNRVGRAEKIFRIGHGGGFYDRAIVEFRQLAESRGWLFESWGLGFSVQQCDALRQVWGQDQTLSRLFMPQKRCPSLNTAKIQKQRVEVMNENDE